MPDHDVLFAQLREKVMERITPHVILLRSKDCSGGVCVCVCVCVMVREGRSVRVSVPICTYTGMKATMKEILRQLMWTNEVCVHIHLCVW